MPRSVHTATRRDTSSSFIFMPTPLPLPPPFDMALLSGSEEEHAVEKTLRHLSIEDTPSPLLHALTPSIIPSPGASNPSSSPDRPTKKSHARRKPPGHIPRPRNAFILFRCDFVAQKKVPASVEHDHRNISRIAGRIWQGMGETERAPWVTMAAKEKQEHRSRYPGYRYTPVGEVDDANTRREKRKTGKTKARQEYSEPWQTEAVLPRLEIPEEIDQLDADRVDRWGRPPQDSAFAPPRRSSSCPPPAMVPQLDPLHYIASMAFVQDDMQRRPSRVFQGLYPTSFPSDEGVSSWSSFPNSYQWSPAHDEYANSGPNHKGPIYSSSSLPLDTQSGVPSLPEFSGTFNDPFRQPMIQGSYSLPDGCPDFVEPAPDLGPGSFNFDQRSDEVVPGASASPFDGVAHIYQQRFREISPIELCPESSQCGASLAGLSPGIIGFANHGLTDDARFTDSEALSSYHHALPAFDVTQTDLYNTSYEDVTHVIDDTFYCSGSRQTSTP